MVSAVEETRIFYQSQGIPWVFHNLRRFLSGPATLLVPFRAPALLRWGFRTLKPLLDACIRDPLLKAVLAAGLLAAVFLLAHAPRSMATAFAGVLVVNQSGGNSRSVAEHVLAMMLSLSKRIGEADRALRQLLHLFGEILRQHRSAEQIGLRCENQRRRAKAGDRGRQQRQAPRR